MPFGLNNSKTKQFLNHSKQRRQVTLPSHSNTKRRWVNHKISSYSNSRPNYTTTYAKRKQHLRLGFLKAKSRSHSTTEVNTKKPWIILAPFCLSLAYVTMARIWRAGCSILYFTWKWGPQTCLVVGIFWMFKTPYGLVTKRALSIRQIGILYPLFPLAIFSISSEYFTFASYFGGRGHVGEEGEIERQPFQQSMDYL